MKHNIVWRVAILCHGLAQGAEFNPAIDKYFSGSELAKKALQLDKQQAVLDAAPTDRIPRVIYTEIFNKVHMKHKSEQVTRKTVNHATL